MTETWQPWTVQAVLFRHSHCLRGQKQKDIDFYIWAKNERVAKEVDRWKEDGNGEREEESDLKGDLSLELQKVFGQCLCRKCRSSDLVRVRVRVSMQMMF